MAARDGRSSVVGFFGRFAFGLMLIAALALFIMDMAGNAAVRAWRAAAADQAKPALEAVSAPARFFGGLIEDFRSYRELVEENARLRRQLQEIDGWRNRAYDLDRENARLRALNRVSLPPRISYVTAQVIADSSGPFSRSRLLNVGSDGGAVDGAAVVDGSGLAGRVVSLGRRSARVLLLTDLSSRVPVYIDPGGQRAVLFGDGEARPVLRFITPDTPLQRGARVYTSGDGRVFPRGLTVGRVAEADRNGLRVDLEADYNDLAFVRVLRYEAVRHEESDPPLIDRPDPNAPESRSESRPEDT